jgi:Tol biopolymer transport system component
VRYLDVESQQERVLSRCTRFGWLSGNADNSTVVGASSSVATPNIYVLFTSLHREITVCEHASSGKPYPIAGTNSQDRTASWPEPAFSPDSRWVYFASDKEGQPAIYRADVSDLVEDT